MNYQNISVINQDILGHQTKTIRIPSQRKEKVLGCVVFFKLFIHDKEKIRKVIFQEINKNQLISIDHRGVKLINSS